MVSVWATAAHSHPGFLVDWRDTYPDSRSDEINCQLCHQSVDGGQPWNAYGFELRFYLQNGNDQFEAFALAENSNSDNDPAGLSNLDEINADATKPIWERQPGWEPGPVNTIFYSTFTVNNQLPPEAVDPFPDPLESHGYDIQLVEVGSGFTSPVGGVAAPVEALANQLFIVDQTGIVWRMDLETGNKEVFIDVSAQLVPLGAFQPGGYDERGLLGFAFHPDYVETGLVYLYTSEPVSGSADFSTLGAGEVADHQSVVTELTILNPLQTTGAATILGGSERVILSLDQPQFNHNGGDLLFDQDSMLLISVGDGGAADDQGTGHGANGNGNDPTNPFGAILRIDPLGGVNGAQYGIPADNPFINDPQILDEIYAYGFRNPWRMSFDGQNLYVADVGQNHVEEVDLVEAGGHYGWNYKEGSLYFLPNDDLPGYVTSEVPAGLPPIDFKDPILEYDHGEGISVIGGRVYRGGGLLGLNGKYIFGDFLKRLFVGDPATGEIKVVDTDVDFFVYGFAQDQSGELYVTGVRTDAPFPGTSGTDGVVLKLISSELCFPIRKNNRIVILCL